MNVTGGCHCGNITYKAEINPDNIVICHCTDCQVLSGSSFRTVSITPESNFSLLSGEIKTYIKTAQSGNLREQNFCPECGSPIYATSVGGDDRIFGIRVGTINERNELRPKKQIFCKSAHDWVEDLQSMPKS